MWLRFVCVWPAGKQNADNNKKNSRVRQFVRNWKIKLFSQHATTHENNFRFNIVHMLEHWLVISVRQHSQLHCLSGVSVYLAKINALLCVCLCAWRFRVLDLYYCFVSLSIAKTFSIVFPFHIHKSLVKISSVRRRHKKKSSKMFYICRTNE